MIKFRFPKLKVLQNKIRRAEDRLDNDVYSNVRKEADYIETNSKIKAPYDTGELSNSQYRKESLTKKDIKIKIGFGAEHAPFQEFGTLKRFSLNTEYSEFSEFAMNFKVYGPTMNRKGNRPRRYFLHYYVIARRNLSRKTKTFIKNILK